MALNVSWKLSASFHTSVSMIDDISLPSSSWLSSTSSTNRDYMTAILGIIEKVSFQPLTLVWVVNPLVVSSRPMGILVNMRSVLF